MEAYGQAYGFILYRTHLQDAVHGILALPGLNDYAQIYVNKQLEGTLDRRLKHTSLHIDATAGSTLDILVENDGRVSSSHAIRQAAKGLPNGAMLDGKPLKQWQVFTLPMKNFHAVHFHRDTPSAGPAFWRTRFRVGSVGDTFLDIRDLKKGAVWINGHAIGRYWDIGPQDTLYVPGPWLHRGWNQIVIFDVEDLKSPHVAGLTQPILNGPVRSSDTLAAESAAP